MHTKLKKGFSFEFFSKGFEPFTMRFEYTGKSYEIVVIPLDNNKKGDSPLSFYLIIENKLEEIHCCFDSWKSKTIKDEELTKTIGYYIYKRYDLEGL